MKEKDVEGGAKKVQVVTRARFEGLKKVPNARGVYSKSIQPMGLGDHGLPCFQLISNASDATLLDTYR